MNLKPYITTPENAGKIADWLRTRGGIAIWQSVDFNRLGETITTPVRTFEGDPVAKPGWWVGNQPARIITDPADVIVAIDVEVKRFHIAIRAGSNGLLFKCTDGASRRIRAAVAKAGEGAYHVFDYSAQDAVIMMPESQIPLHDYLAQIPVGSV